MQDATSQAAPNYASPTIARRLFNSSSSSVQVTPSAVHQPTTPAPSTGQCHKRNHFTGNLLPGIVGMLSSPGQQNARIAEFATAKDRQFEATNIFNWGKGRQSLLTSKGVPSVDQEQCFLKIFLAWLVQHTRSR
jgi:hypothetical protein